MFRLLLFSNGQQIVFTRIHFIYKLNYGLHKRYISLTNYNKSKDRKHSSDTDENEIQIPEPPTNCCMSGCPNCVWVEYAETLSKIFKDSGEKSREIIMNKVTDVNMKAFLNMELRILERRLKDKKDNGDKGENGDDK